MNNTERNAPATLHSRVKKEKTSAQVTTSGSMPSDTSLPKDEPQSRIDRMKSEVPTPKLEPPMLDVKEEMGEPDATEQVPDTLKEEAQDETETQPLDSEDSLSQERVAAELRRLTEIQAHTVGDAPCRENSVSYAPQRPGRCRGDYNPRILICLIPLFG